ncbi:MAG: GTP pyrophosphokinase [Acidobacteriota bacterium]
MAENQATLEDAILLSVQAHRGQRDKVGKPYVLHPLRMMLALESDDERIVAVLHDVVEDTPHTFEDLRARGFSEDVIAALGCVTRRPDETYDAFIDRVKGNPLAVRVKIADLEDNMDVKRLTSVGEKDRERLARYVKAWRELRELAR